MGDPPVCKPSPLGRRQNSGDLLAQGVDGIRSGLNFHRRHRARGHEVHKLFYSVAEISNRLREVFQCSHTVLLSFRRNVIVPDTQQCAEARKTATLDAKILFFHVRNTGCFSDKMGTPDSRFLARERLCKRRVGPQNPPRPILKAVSR